MLHFTVYYLQIARSNRFSLIHFVRALLKIINFTSISLNCNFIFILYLTPTNPSPPPPNPQKKKGTIPGSILGLTSLYSPVNIHLYNEFPVLPVKMPRLCRGLRSLVLLLTLPCWCVHYCIINSVLN